jgi:hypothetical protein
VFSVHQHWDPLQVCAVGRSYPPEFYSWIKVPRVRNLFERIAQETEEDFQNIIRTLAKFNVTVVRPDIAEFEPSQRNFPAPPMTPRDYCLMIGNTFYECISLDLVRSYELCKDPSWPVVRTWDDYYNLPDWIRQELDQMHGVHDRGTWLERCWKPMFDLLNANQVPIREHHLDYDLNGAMVTRLGRDLYFGTMRPGQDRNIIQRLVSDKFPDYRTHVVNTEGHADATYCPVCPGLIISLCDVDTYTETFPDWEVIYLEHEGWSKVKPFVDLKKRNKGKWWIPGFEYDDAVIEVVDGWMDHWVGFVEETVFDVNMLIIDPKNVMVFNENDKVFEALARYGITPHVVPFRHRYFWDGGIHCVTTDLHRLGQQQDLFPGRNRD